MARIPARVLERGEDGSEVTLSVIPGGLRVITERVPGARSASVGVWVGVGSADERGSLAGASHFLEHLLFKGTRRRSGRDISTAIDAVGGELNAFTAHEYTCYYAHVLASATPLAVALVCDVVLDAVLANGDVDLERSVILEEIAMRDDDPEDTLADLFAAALFTGNPVADPVIGSEASVTAMKRSQIAGYYHRRYAPQNMVVAVAGRVDHGEVVDWVREAFTGRLDSAGTASAPRVGGRPIRPLAGIKVSTRDIEQAHVSVGVPALARNDPRRPIMAVLSGALGGGMSSRLFRSIREERGLAYSCYAATSAYAGTGSLSVYAGCAPENLGLVSKLIGEELAKVAEHGLAADELERVKGQLTGGFLLGLEDNESRMSRIGKNLLVRTEYRSVNEEMRALSAVTGDQVTALARELLRRPLTGAVVGPFAGSDDLPSELLNLTR